MMIALVTAALAFSGSHLAPSRPSAVQMSMSSDLKKGLATLALVSVAVMPMASDAVMTDLPSSAMALKPNVVKRDLPEGEPNKLKKGFTGLGLTTGFRSKKPTPAPAFKPPASAKIFKGTIGSK